jgi:hypothetical protein
LTRWWKSIWESWGKPWRKSGENAGNRKEECEGFIKNVQLKHPDLAQQARRRKVELLASAYGGAMNEAEIEALQAIYAYEEVLFARHGRKTQASRTWQMVKRHGIIEAVERAVNRKKETIGYTALVEMGMQDFAFEAVVMRHPELFSQGAVARSKQRLREWTLT